jgi:integrase
MAFHEKAGRSQGGSMVFSWTSFFFRRVASTVATLPSAPSGSDFDRSVDLGDFTEFAWLTGMRKREIASLAWENVDGDMIRLRAEDAKSRKPRVIPLEGELAELRPQNRRDVQALRDRGRGRHEDRSAAHPEVREDGQLTDNGQVARGGLGSD